MTKLEKRLKAVRDRCDAAGIIYKTYPETQKGVVEVTVRKKTYWIESTTASCDLMFAIQKDFDKDRTDIPMLLEMVDYLIDSIWKDEFDEWRKEPLEEIADKYSDEGE